MEPTSLGETESSQHAEPKLWTRDFTLVTAASALGAAGLIAGRFALSFFVFDETGSTLASALIIAVELVPYVFVPLIISPVMDRLPRKAFLVAGDAVCGIAYALLGLYLMFFEFSYSGYLVVSLLLACLEAVDELAWTSIYPEVIPLGTEQKGNAVSSMLYTTLTVIMAPFGALLLDAIGVAMILVIQGGLAIAASGIESRIHVESRERGEEGAYTFSSWISDIREMASYLKGERGLRGLFGYMAFSNGLATGYTPILIAFFRTAPGFSAAMYALFSGAEFAGRSLGSALQYKVKIPREKRFGLCFFVYLFYDLMDACLLWLSFPLMLANRAACGFLASNSIILRSSGMQRYIPEHMRSRVNAFQVACSTAVCSVFAVGVGALGELLDYRVCITVCGFAAIITSILFIWVRREHVRKIFEAAE